MKIKPIAISTIVAAGMMFTGCEKSSLQSPSDTASADTEVVKKLLKTTRMAT
jgi:hypothetical protein